MISDFGSYYVGGRILEVRGRARRQVPVTADVTLEVDENGHHAVEQAYVQYFVPTRRNDQPPIVLVHGGGLCGTVWEGTPDGRPGWLQHLLSRGFEVHVLDTVERGRAGWSPHVLGDLPVTRSLEEAWRLFRIGPPEGFDARRPFDGQRFPVTHLEDAARFFVPRWTTLGAEQAAALVSVLHRLGRATILAHSQGGETAFTAAQATPRCVAGIIAVEPSAFPATGNALDEIPLTLVTGGFLDTDPLWQNARRRWADVVSDRKAKGLPVAGVALDEIVGPGHSHMPMFDTGSDAALECILEAHRALAAS